MGLSDREKVCSLVNVWAGAKADIIDTSPFVMYDVQKMLLEKGFNLLDFDFCISVPISGDIHAKKAKISQDKCILCAKCKKECSENAIDPPHIKTNFCIGCARCKNVCPNNAILMYDNKNDGLKDFLDTKAKLDTLEIHISIDDIDLIKKEFKEKLFRIKDTDCKISVCLSRKFFSNRQVEKLLPELKNFCGGRNFLVQADGNSMNGGTDDYASTLETVAFGLFCKKLGYNVILSGGTNSYTAKLAHETGFKPSIAYGSYARKLVSGYNYENALKKAKEFVLKTKELIND